MAGGLRITCKLVHTSSTAGATRMQMSDRIKRDALNIVSLKSTVSIAYKFKVNYY